MRIGCLAFIEIDVPNACLIHTREMAEQMAALGNDVTVIMPRPLKMQQWSGVNHVWVRFWGFERLRQWAFFLESAWAIIRMHLRRPFDILYVREMERNPVLLHLVRRLRIPLFVEVSGWILDDLLLLRTRSSRIAAAGGHQRALFQTSAGILVSTVGNARRAVEFYGIPEERVSVQELGANTSHILPGSQIQARSQLDLPLHAKIILFSGSFHPHHDLITLLSAFALALKDCPECVLVLVGTGAQSTFISEQVDKLGLKERVILPGCKQYDEMPVWLRAADVGVVPLSRKKIGQQNGCMALKLWEYMAAGLPVIATDLPGTPSYDLLKDKALLVAPENPQIMNDALLSLLGDSCLRRHLAETGRSYVVECRTWRNAAKETCEFIRKRLRADG